LQQHSESTNSIHVGLDGAIQTVGHDGLGTNSTGWAWTSSIVNQSFPIRASLNVTAPGRHTVDVWVKESGVDFDRLELTTSQIWHPNHQILPTPSNRWNDSTLREAWLNWSLPSDNQWHDYSGETLDLTQRLDNANLRIEHDDISPTIAIHNWRMFTNEGQILDTWVMTDPEATFWMNGTQLPVNQEGRVDLNLTLQPTIWGPWQNGPLDADMWDTSTWRWYDMNEFNFTARDLAGNWNSANASMVYDPWAPANTGPTPQLSFDTIKVDEWGDAYVPVNTNIAYSFNVGEVSITRLFDGKEICLTAYSSTYVEMYNECQIDQTPPWEETPGSNRPIMEENRFTLNMTDWPDDVFELRLDVTDWANNTGSHSTQIQIDRTSPNIAIIVPTEAQIQTDHHLDIEWNVSESSHQWVEINGETVWTSSGFQNGSQELLIEVSRTGNHTVCIHAWDQTAIDGIIGPNVAENCVLTLLPEETYWPTLDAPWNDTHVNTSRVWADITLGPDQMFSWWHDGDNGTLYAIEEGRVSIPIDLQIGENHMVFHLEALEKTFVYDLVVILDQTPPELIVNNPDYGYATYRSIANVEGSCEVGLVVYVNVSGIISHVDCNEDGSFAIAANLPIQEGEWQMVTHQIDLAGNRISDTRTIITDKTAPSANLIWNETDCERQPTAPVWGIPKAADCNVSLKLSILSDDVTDWSLLIQNADVDVFTQSGKGSDFEGLEPETFAAEGEPGVWTATVELIDAAGNRQRLQITTNLNAPEATVGEQLKTPGSIENLVTISIIVALLYVLQMMNSRKPEDGDPWESESTTEMLDSDSMFEDDVVV
jgi:hypothetical protein